MWQRKPSSRSCVCIAAGCLEFYRRKHQKRKELQWRELLDAIVSGVDVAMRSLCTHHHNTEDIGAEGQ
jgi:hypothetical protein